MADVSVFVNVNDVSVPKGATVIDGTDRFLMPGLAEMHAHVTSTSADDIDRLFTLFVANGVTTIRGMLGRQSHLELRERLNHGEVFRPRFYTSGPSLNGRSVSDPDDAARKVRAQQAAGYDFIKVHPGLDAAEFQTLANTANEIGMPFAGHVPVAAGVNNALENNMATIDHLDGYFVALLPAQSLDSGGYGGFFDVMLAADVDASLIRGLARATAESGVWNFPTEGLIEQIIDDTPVAELEYRPENRYVSAATVRRWVQAKQSVAVAEFMGSNGGVIAAGRDGDLVLLDANPLEDIRNSSRIHGVLLKGEWLPDADLQSRLETFVVQEGSGPRK